MVGFQLIFATTFIVNAQVIYDVDGNLYHTIKIGDQIWTKENLRVTHFQNGDPISTTCPDTILLRDDNSSKYQWSFENNSLNDFIYGKLYTWYAIMDNRNVCPLGWHIPNHNEWSALLTFIGGDSVLFKENNLFNVIDISKAGFDGNAGIKRSFNGVYSGNNINKWWSTTDIESISPALSPYTFSIWQQELSSYNEKVSGLPVKCIKD